MKEKNIEFNNKTNKLIEDKIMEICKEYYDIPTFYPAKKRIIVISDIHGDYNLALNMLMKAKVIKIKDNKMVWCGKDTYVVQLGDQVDGCRPYDNHTCDQASTTENDLADDIKILKFFTELNKQAKKQGGQVISLLGNHELMNVEGDFRYVSKKNIDYFEGYKDPETNKTFKTAKEAREYAFSPGHEYSKFLGCTRRAAIIIGSNLFVHAGIINSMLNNSIEEFDLEKINNGIKKWLIGLSNGEDIKKIVEGSSNSMFWTRILGYMQPDLKKDNEECKKNIDKVLKLFNIGHIIVGHTPQFAIHNKGINPTCGDSIWRTDFAGSKVFNKFDNEPNNENRKPQVLEILNDKIFNIIF